MHDLLVRFIRELIDRQEPFVLIKGEVPGVVIGKVVRVVAIAHNEELDEAEERSRISIARIVLVVNDLLHCFAWLDAEGLELDLDARHAIDEDEHVVSVVTVVRAHAELVHNLKRVLAPVLNVDQRVVQRRAVIARKGIDLTQSFGGRVDVRGDDVIEQPGKLTVCEFHTIECIELLSEVLL